MHERNERAALASRLTPPRLLEGRAGTVGCIRARGPILAPARAQTDRVPRTYADVVPEQGKDLVIRDA